MPPKARKTQAIKKPKAETPFSALKDFIKENPLKKFFQKQSKKNQTRYKVTVKYSLIALALATVILAGALTYLNINTASEYPEISREKYAEIESAIKQTLEYSKTHPERAIEALENYGTLPKQLENRKKYILSKLYEKINEPGMAFIRAYDLDKDYLNKYSSFRKVRLAERIGLEAFVMKELKYLKDTYPKDPRFLYEIAKSYARQSRFEEAYDTFLQVQKNYPDTEFALGSDYYLANITADHEDKLTRMRNYLTKSPEGNLSPLVVEQIFKLDKQDQAKFSDLTNYIALSYYHKEDYENAIRFFNTKYNAADLYIKAMTDTLIKLNRKEEAEELLLKRIADIQNEKLATEMLNLLLSLAPKYVALEHLQMLENQMPKIKGKILLEIAKRTKYKEDYELVYRDGLNSPYAADSMAIVFWKELKLQNYDKAIDIYKEYWDRFPESGNHAFVAFWTGKIHKLQGQEDKARAVFQNLIIAHPHDYYSYRAQQILDNDKKWFKLSGANEFISLPSWEWPEIYTKDALIQTYGKDIAELTDIGEYEFILELGDDKEIKLDNDFRLWLYAQTGDFYRAIVEADKSIDTKETVSYDKLKFHYAYPLPYADLISDEVSTNLKVDPMLVHALIKQESHYTKNVLSPVGAVGLMQIMPYTARDLSKTMDLGFIPTNEDLMKPDINIKLGVKYMEEMLAKFQNNLIYTIASYNAGPDAVTDWVKKADMDPDLFVESIPYPETKNYVKKILTNFWIYKQLYS